MPTAPETKTRKFSPLMSFGFAVLLAFVHVFVSIVLAFVGNQTVSNVANVFGVVLGTLTLAVAFGLWKKSWTWAIVSFFALFIWNAILSTIALFAEPWLGNLMFGFAIIFLCPLAFGLMLYNWPAKTTAVEETKKVITTLEPVSAPLTVPAEVISPAHVRFLERTNHLIELVLAGAHLNDTSTPLAFMWNDNEKAMLLQQQIEERFAILFATFNQGKGLSNDTNDVLPFMVEEEKPIE